MEGLTLAENVGHIGGVVYDRSAELGQLLSAADTALRTSQQMGGNKWNIDDLADESDASVRGQQQWREILNTALEEKNCIFVWSADCAM